MVAPTALLVLLGGLTLSFAQSGAPPSAGVKNSPAATITQPRWMNITLATTGSTIPSVIIDKQDSRICNCPKLNDTKLAAVTITVTSISTVPVSVSTVYVPTTITASVSVFCKTASNPPAKLQSTTTQDVFPFIVTSSTTSWLNGPPPSDASVVIASEPSTIVVVPTPDPDTETTITVTSTNRHVMTTTIVHGSSSTSQGASASASSTDSEVDSTIKLTRTTYKTRTVTLARSSAPFANHTAVQPTSSVNQVNSTLEFSKTVISGPAVTASTTSTVSGMSVSSITSSISMVASSFKPHFPLNLTSEASSTLDATTTKNGFGNNFTTIAVSSASAVTVPISSIYSSAVLGNTTLSLPVTSMTSSSLLPVLTSTSFQEVAKNSTSVQSDMDPQTSSESSSIPAASSTTASTSIRVPSFLVTESTLRISTTSSVEASVSLKPGTVIVADRPALPIFNVTHTQQ